jgi:hypothetical protein
MEASEKGWHTVFDAKVVSWEITFEGRKAELVLADALRSASAQTN